MTDQIGLHAVVYGHVQGVYFRAFVAKNAVRLGLTGRVKNLDTVEAVEVRAEGNKDALEEMIELLKTGPPHARVDKITTEWTEYSGKHKDFRIEYF